MQLLHCTAPIVAGHTCESPRALQKEERARQEAFLNKHWLTDKRLTRHLWPAFRNQALVHKHQLWAPAGETLRRGRGIGASPEYL